MKRFNFNNKPIVESPYPPQDTNVLWVNIDENTGKVGEIKRFRNGVWESFLQSAVNQNKLDVSVNRVELCKNSSCKNIEPTEIDGFVVYNVDELLSISWSIKIYGNNLGVDKPNFMIAGDGGPVFGDELNNFLNALGSVERSNELWVINHDGIDIVANLALIIFDKVYEM